MKTLFTLLFLSLPVFGQVTSTKTVTVTVNGSTQTVADNKADRIVEDYVLGTRPGLLEPARVAEGVCANIVNDIYQREAADAIAPLVPCAVKRTAGGATRLLSTATLNAVFQRTVRQHIQAVVRDRRTLDATETARKTAATVADEIDPQ